MIRNHKKLLKYLLGIVIIGAILGIENSQAFGCVFGLEMLSIGNLVFLLISSLLLYKAIKTENTKMALQLLAIETMIWILKYLF